MGLSLPSEQDKEMPEEIPLPDTALTGPHTSLERLIHLLQGSPEPCLADVGIAPLPYAQLDNLSNSAKREAELCQDRLDLFLELLECCVDNNATPEPDTLVRMTRQLLRLVRDQRRWHDLGDNAAYYRDNAPVAARISHYLSCRQREG